MCFNLNILQVHVLNAYSSDDDAVGEGCGTLKKRDASLAAGGHWGTGSKGFYKLPFLMVYHDVNSLL